MALAQRQICEYFRKYKKMNSFRPHTHTHRFLQMTTKTGKMKRHKIKNKIETWFYPQIVYPKWLQSNVRYHKSPVRTKNMWATMTPMCTPSQCIFNYVAIYSIASILLWPELKFNYIRWQIILFCCMCYIWFGTRRQSASSHFIIDKLVIITQYALGTHSIQWTHTNYIYDSLFFFFLIFRFVLFVLSWLESDYSEELCQSLVSLIVFFCFFFSVTGDNMAGYDSLLVVLFGLNGIELVVVMMMMIVEFRLRRAGG